LFLGYIADTGILSLIYALCTRMHATEELIKYNFQLQIGGFFGTKRVRDLLRYLLADFLTFVHNVLLAVRRVWRLRFMKRKPLPLSPD
jgi:hypothetical protein